MTLRIPALVATLLIPATAHADDIPSTLTVDTSGRLPAGVTWKDVTGKDDPKATLTIERILRWNEGSGAHVAVFATREKVGQKDGSTYTSKSLHVGVFNVQGDAPKKIHAIIEAVQPCELDLTARFIDGSISLTNLDGDDQAELTFAYVTQCAGDLSPKSMKVLMLEGKDRHALRGQALLDMGDGLTDGGQYKVDFKKAPKVLVDHAKAVWERFVSAN